MSRPRSTTSDSKTRGQNNLVRSPTIPINMPGPGYPVKSWGPLYPPDSQKPRTEIMKDMHDGKMTPIDPCSAYRYPKLPRGTTF